MESIREKFRRINKYRLVVSIVGAFLIALLIATVFGRDKFEPKRTKDGKLIPTIRGEPRRHKRQTGATSTVTSSSSSGSSQSNLKDPFANRPRIQTRNGHLLIESSRDKNIEFRTNGQRGTVSINGVKLDQLFGVAKALDKSHRLIKSNPSLKDSSSILLDGDSSIDDHYDAILRNILTSGQKLTSLERTSAELRSNLTRLNKKLVTAGRRLSKRTSQLKALSQKLDQIETKLKENDCFDANGQPVCKNGAVCIDSYSSFKCLCPDQYEGPTCENDVDECAKFRGTDLGCQNGAKCNNFPGGYSCECPPNYHGVHCTEKHDDCALSSSSTLCGHGKCVNLARMVPNQARYECICDQGWTTDPSTSSPACVLDINECIVSNGSGSGNLSVPSSAYPCSQNPFVECINLPGSFECAPCPPGFTGNGRVCRDIDECTIGNGGCSTNPFVECINTFGSRRCASCPPGFVGDGQECKQASICNQETNGGCHDSAKCLELVGVSAGTNRLCVCQYPFVGNGVGPQGCRLVGSAESQGPMIISNRTQDDCHPNPCLNGADCRLTDSSFECLCTGGYTGRLCDQETDLTCGGVLASEGVFDFPVGGSFAKLIDYNKNATVADDSSIASAVRNGQRHYECRWTIIATKSDKSLRLTFSKIANKVNPNKSIQIWLADAAVKSTSGQGQASRHIGTNSPTCSERLDVRERLESELVAAGAERRLMTRICTQSSSSSTSSSSSASATHLSGKNSNITLTIDASAVDLEYSFTATKTQFAEPSLAFTVIWNQTEPTCGGTLPVVESGSLASPQFPEFYSPGIECRYILRVPPSQRIRIQFGELTLRTVLSTAPNSNCADSLTLLDGSIGSDRPILLRHCANDINQSDRLRASLQMKTIVSSSSTVELVLRSSPKSVSPLLRPKQQKGFYLTYSSEPATPGCGGLYTAKQATITSDDYEQWRSLKDKNQRELALTITSFFVTQQQQIQQQQQQQHLQQKNKQKYRARSNDPKSFGTSKSQQSSDMPTDLDNDSFDVLNEPDLSQTWQATRSSNLWQQQFQGLRKKRAPGKQKSGQKSRDVDLPGNYAKRCEYEIRPEQQRRNHRIQIDTLDMLGADLDAKARLDRRLRRDRCDYTRLLVYDGIPTPGEIVQSYKNNNSNTTKDRSTNSYFVPTSSAASASSVKEAISNTNLLATFCGSDLYDSKLMQSIVSSGHVLYLVYETRYDSLAFARQSSNNFPFGFSLRYSTICSGTYRQLSGEILTELDEFVNDCVYHIALPPNNTISLSIEPKDGIAGEQAMILPNGSCAIQAMFIDGAMQRGWSAPEQRQERVLSFPVGASANIVTDTGKTTLEDVPFVPDDQQSIAIIGMTGSTSGEGKKSRVDDYNYSDFSDVPLSSSSTGSGQKHTKYWQYVSSPVQDVKLFDVCHIQALTFESTWNHVSLRFRLVDSVRSPSGSGDSSTIEGDETGGNGMNRLPVSQFQLVIRYQSEAACGGIISWPPKGNITLTASESIKSLDKYPLTIGRWEQLHRNEFTNQCAWILRNKHNQVISLEFNVPVEEIESRRKAWFEWKRQSLKIIKSNSSNSTRSANEDLSFNCSEAFTESIELYEPSLNRSRFLCPTDLAFDKIATKSSNYYQINKWTTQSDTVYVRLHNNSLAAPSNNNRSSDQSSVYQRKPLSGNITMSYTLEEILAETKCGGRLLQDSGVIRSPRWPFNYPEHITCIWHIDTGKQQQIRLNFTNFELDPCPTTTLLENDLLELHNGPTRNSPLIGRFCGTQLQSRVIITQSNQLWMMFISDGFKGGRGFEVHFDAAQTGCGGSLSSLSGELDSPNYPYPYAHSAECEWTIQVPRSNRIKLLFIELDLKSSPSASSNQMVPANKSSDCSVSGPDASYLEVFDSSSGDRASSKSFGRICHINQLNRFLTNNAILPRIISSSNKLFITYKSQALDVGRGFRLLYRTMCNDIQLMGTYGVIESPGYPERYDMLEHCNWSIRAPIGSNITILIADLGIYSLTEQQRIRNATLASLGAKLIGSSVHEAPNRENCQSEYVEIVQPAQISVGTNMTNTSVKTNSSKDDSMTTNSWKFCGRIEELSDKERTIEIPTNQAQVEFRSDIEIHHRLRGFRLEWRAHGCGSQQVGGDFIKPIEFNEQVNLTKFKDNAAILTTGIECLYTIDMSRDSWIGSLELQVNSDLRSSKGSVPATTNDDDDRACNTSSLTIYDGLDDQKPILLRNCDGTFKSHESVITSSNQVLIRFYVKPIAATTSTKTQVKKGQIQFGMRNFQISTWPAARIGCLTSVYSIATPYNQMAGSQKSPNYPDLYSGRDYHCYGTIAVKSGRVRITVDELDIPVSVEGSENGLLDEQQCQKSRNYLALANRHDLTNAAYLCGKYNGQVGDGGTITRPEFVSRGLGGSIEFESHNSLQGRWKLSYSRLCGSEVIIESSRDFASPNYPNKPNWATQTGLGSSNDAAVAGMTDKVCIWHIKARTVQSSSARRIHLQVVNFVESPGQNASGSSSDCLRVYEGTDVDLRTSRFNLTDLDSSRYKSSQMIKLCKQSDMKHNNWQYLSKGNKLTVLISGDAIVKVRANAFENYCGGDMSLDQAEFASPNFPLPYGSDLDCYYFIHGAPGSTITLKFPTFDLPEPISGDVDEDGKPSCDNVDHVEIRSINTHALVAKGVAKLSKKLALYNRFWLFETKRLSVKTAPTTTTTTTTTQKPTVKAGKRRGKNSTATIDQQQPQDSTNMTLLINLYNRFDLLAKIDMIYRGQTGQDVFEGDEDDSLRFSSDTEVSQPSLALDEFFDSSFLVNRYCGRGERQAEDKRDWKISGDEIQFHKDRVLVRFRSHGNSDTDTKQHLAARGFLAEYKIQYGGLKYVWPDRFQDQFMSFSPQEYNGVDEYIRNSVIGGAIASPQFPSLNRQNASIVWTFETLEGYIIQFELVSLQIGHPHQDCTDDALSIFDGLRQSDSLRLARLCGMLKYRDNGRKYGRRRSNMSVQGLRKSVQNIMPIYEAHNPLVRSALIKRIRTSTNVASVVYDSFKTEGMFLLRYTAVDKSKAKLQNDTDTVVDETFVLQEEFDRKSTAEEESYTALDMSKVSKSCSARYELSLDNGGNQSNVSLSSPFPTITKDIVECHWLVYTRENTQLKFMFEPPVAYLYEESSDNDGQSASGYKRQPDYCLDRDYKGQTRQYIIAHDGASHLAPQIARYCLPAPPMALLSTGRHLFIRYVQVSSAPSQAISKRSKGFKITVQLDKCGGQHHVLSSMRLRDRQDSSKNYSNNLDCTYYLLAKRPEYVILILNQMSEFHLAPTPTDANCTVGDYIEIKDVPLRSEDTIDYSRSLAGRSLGRYCAGRPLEYIESPGMAMAIHFHTDSSNTGPGFELSVMSGHPRRSCPRGYQTLNASEPFGLLMSPNWPHGFLGKRHCKYQLVAPMDSSIEITFIRYRRNLAPSEGSMNSNCKDKFSYLADNEASALRYSSLSLKEIQSPIGGTLIRQLVRDIPCKSNYMYIFGDSLNSKLLSAESSPLATSDQYGFDANPVESFATISPNEYQRLMGFAPNEPLRIYSNGSHVLMLDYEAQDLAANGGFLAVYKLIDHAQANSDTETDSESNDKQQMITTSPFCGSSYVLPGSMIRSGRFGTLMKQSDQFIQCEWKLKSDTTSDNVEDMYFSLTKPEAKSNGTVDDEFVLTRSDSIGTFTSSYLVFQVLEIPSLSRGPYMEERWYAERNAASNEACGLHRLMVSDSYKHDAFFTCGNWTDSYRVLFLELSVNLVSLRTKNLPLESPNNPEAQSNPVSLSDSSGPKFHRGLLAYFHENECLQIERTVGESIRIRSHPDFNRQFDGTSMTSNRTVLHGSESDGYKPGVCRWQIHLKPGTYEFTFATVNFRPPEGALTVSINSNGNNNMLNPTDCPDGEDFLEIRASTGPYAPALERYCYRNQKAVQNYTSKQLTMNTTGELTVLFSAGLTELSHGLTEFKPRTRQTGAASSNDSSPAAYGFDMRVRRVQESTLSDFCKPTTKNSVYTFITSADFSEGSLYSQSSSLRTFLYPKNAHCTVSLMVDEDSRLNMTFRGIFDIEPSQDCQNDYVQLDELILTNAQQNDSLSTDAPTTKQAKPIKTQSTAKPTDRSKSRSKTTIVPTSTTTTTVRPVNTMRPYQRFDTKLIGRFCGRDIPRDNFVTVGNKVRITFHSNGNSIIGKGFNLEFSII